MKFRGILAWVSLLCFFALRSFGIGAWTNIDVGTNINLTGVATANGRIVAVGDDGSILTSTDAIHWNACVSPVNEALTSVAFGNGLFVATADNGDAITSTNGTDWTQSNYGTSWYTGNLVFGNGLFMALTQGIMFLASPDGTNWTTLPTIPPDQSWDFYLQGLNFANGMFFVDAGGNLYYSNNGTNWSAANVNAPSGNSEGDSFDAVAYGNHQFVSLGDDGIVIVSTDGTNWIQSTNLPVGGTSAMTFENGRYLAIGSGGLVEITTDGTNWFTDDSGTSNQLNALVNYNGTGYVVVGDSGTILDSQLPQIGPLALDTNGTFHFNVTGLSGSTAIVEAATNFASPNWQPIGTNQIINSSAMFSDSATAPSKFYRARVQ